MKKYLLKTVIVPCDFSEMSKSALEAALELADSPDKVEVIHVTAYPATFKPGVVWGDLSEFAIEENLKKSFSAFLEDAKLPDVKFTTCFGDPGSRITEFAEEKDAGLIVISSHGRTGVNRLLIGSVAERVVRLAPCPVLVLRGDNES